VSAIAVVASARQRRWLALAVVMAASIPYLQTVNDYFMQDDFGVIQLLSSRPWNAFPMWFVMPWTERIFGYTPDEIRPFVALTYQVTALPGGARPELHHLLNIAIHAANALMVMTIARVGVRLSPVAAAYAGVIFAVLPMQAESVAYITGRVDSMPTFFYLATFLAYVRWRNGPERPLKSSERQRVPLFSKSWDLIALGCFFIALFSKQNTITMVATLISYDVLVLDRARRGSVVSCLKAWLPFILLTLGYLAYRRALMGESVRGGIQSAEQLAVAARVIGRHMQRTISGHAPPAAAWEWIGAVVVVATVLVFLGRNTRFVGPAVCFGVAWWMIGAAPVVLAGYESPRHVYLASAAWAFVLGLFVEVMVWAARSRSRPLSRAGPLLLGALIAGTYIVRLHAEVNRWGRSAEISQAAVARVFEEVAASPAGTLMLVGVPDQSWAWGVPFVLQPPYTSIDLSRRTNFISPFRLHCCGGQWNTDTRKKLAAWQNAATPGPVVVLHFAPNTGAVSRQTDTDKPELRAAMHALTQTASREALDVSIHEILRGIGGPTSIAIPR
jgi:hypothetical protein